MNKTNRPSKKTELSDDDVLICSAALDAAVSASIRLERSVAGRAIWKALDDECQAELKFNTSRNAANRSSLEAHVHATKNEIARLKSNLDESGTKALADYLASMKAWKERIRSASAQ